MNYDQNNAFAKILRGELPCKKVYEDDHVLAFHDIHPLANVHVLVIPKGPYLSLNEFIHGGSDVELAALLRGVGHVVKAMGIEKSGYRILVNTGTHGGQEVPHLHVHIFGGKRLGRMLPE
jgi:diadenosine tetraphosphate (Ap4A) HIT family hydrolase